jgi:prefoldin subunit 5
MDKINNMDETNVQKLNNQLKRIEDKIKAINKTATLINEKLDELIKALHDYDEDLSSEIE